MLVIMDKGKCNYHIDHFKIKNKQTDKIKKKKKVGLITVLIISKLKKYVA